MMIQRWTHALIVGAVMTVAIFIAGCSQTPYFEPVQPSSSIRSVLYIYRPEAENPGLQPLRYSYPEIFIDDASIGVLRFNKHRYLELTAGKHTIRVTGLSKIADWEPKDIVQEFSVEAGKINYLKLNVQYRMEQMNLGENKPVYSIYVTPVNSEEAIYEIRHTEVEH